MRAQRCVGLALATLVFTSAAAQSQVTRVTVIQGTVIDALTRAAVVDARVVLRTPRAADFAITVTDSTGGFLVRAPRGGTYRLRVTHPEYVMYEADSVGVRSGEAVMLEIRLGRSAIPLEPLVVTARRNAGMVGFEERQAAGFGRFIEREDIERRAAFRTSDLLRGIQGLSLIQSGGTGGMMVLMRGGGTGLCQPALWVDGVFVRQVPGSTIDDFLSPDTIEGVEVYPSYAAAPAEYAVAGCGVIVVWTRRGSREGGPWQWKKLLAGAGAALIVIWLIAR